MEKLTCAEAKQIDFVSFLASLGHLPAKIRGEDYWFLSPFREERTASFKVNRKQNIWYDHSSGQGGNLIDFGIRYYACSISGLLRILAQQRDNLPFHQPFQETRNIPFADEKKEDTGRILVKDVRLLTDKSLLDYLAERKIPTRIAERECKEVDFTLYGKKYTAIGFENSAGGYELRSRDFKGSSSPKALTLIGDGSKNLAVFEGFFNYLSYLSIHEGQGHHLTDFIILNSLSFFEKSKQLMDKYQHVLLYLDRDTAGIRSTLQAISWNQEKYTDHSQLYNGHKDLNEWLTESGLKVKSSQKLRRGP